MGNTIPIHRLIHTCRMYINSTSHEFNSIYVPDMVSFRCHKFNAVTKRMVLHPRRVMPHTTEYMAERIISLDTKVILNSYICFGKTNSGNSRTSTQNLDALVNQNKSCTHKQNMEGTCIGYLPMPLLTYCHLPRVIHKDATVLNDIDTV